MRSFAICAIVWICSASIAKVASHEETLFDEVDQECIIESDVDQNLVMEANKERTVPAEDAKYKAFLSCTWKKLGLQHEDGKVNWDKVQESLEQAGYSPKVATLLKEKCMHHQGETDGDTVALVLKCLDEHAPHKKAVHSHYGG